MNTNTNTPGFEGIAPAAPQAGVPPFQQRVQPWLMECFGPMIAGDREERNHRFLEEALELVQACGCSASEAHQLVDYVFGREVGEPDQEVGGVMVTLAALCLANGLEMHAAGETELARIWTKVESIRAKQAAKPKHSPLPQAAPVLAVPSQSEEKCGSPDTHHGIAGAPADFSASWYECCMDGSPCRGCNLRGSATPIAAQPAAQPADPATKGMMLAACADLGRIAERLGLDPDDAGADPIIAAIDDLIAAQPADAQPDMFWDDADTERGLSATSEEEAVQEIAYDATPGDLPFEIVLQRAQMLPNVRVRVTALADDDGNGFAYEVIDAARTQGGAHG